MNKNTIKKGFLISVGWVFKSVGLISNKDYENFKFNLPLMLHKNARVIQ